MGEAAAAALSESVPQTPNAAVWLWCFPPNLERPKAQ